MRNVGLQLVGPAASSQVVGALHIGQPAVVLLTEPDVGTVDALTGTYTGTLVGRLVADGVAPTSDICRNLAERCKRRADELGRRIKYWQAANEPLTGGGNDIDSLRRWGEFDVLFAQILHRAGLKTTTSAWSTGTPQAFTDGEVDMRWWAAWWDTGVLDEADVLSVHEYYHHLDGYTWGWNIGRLARLWPHVPTVWQNKPVLLSEVGFETSEGGWRNVIPMDQYFKAMQKVSGGLRPNWSATIFAIAADARWVNYDVRELLPLLTGAWQASGERVEWPMTQTQTDNLSEIAEEHVRGTAFRFQDIRTMFPDRADATWFHSQTQTEIAQLVVHHTATTPATLSRHIYEDHLERFGGMGYHLLLYPSNRLIRLVRDPLTWGAHVKGQNENKLGLAVVGDYTRLEPEAALEILKVTVGIVDRWLGRPITVTSHQRLMPSGYTECPGTLNTLVDELNLRVDTRGYQQGFRDGITAAQRAILAALAEL